MCDNAGPLGLRMNNFSMTSTAAGVGQIGQAGGGNNFNFGKYVIGAGAKNK